MTANTVGPVDNRFTQEEFDHALALAVRMVAAARTLPGDADVTEQEKALALQLEAEVDAAFGPDARLYGRAVALYAVRDLLGEPSSKLPE